MDVRRDFPITKKCAFLDNCAVAPISRQVRDAIENYLESRMLFPRGSVMAQHIEWDAKGLYAREEAAKLLKARREEIALTINTTYGINSIASMIKWRRGDNVVVNDLEFPGNVIPWLSLSRFGVKVKTVKNRGGMIRIEDIQKMVDSRTRVVAVSWVQWTNGFKVDLRRLSEEVTSPRQVYLSVDAVQGLGCLELDIHRAGVDFMASSSHKWLCGPFGVGILYVRKDLIPGFEPRFQGSRSISTKARGLREYENPDFHPIDYYSLGFKDDAERFGNPGSPNAESIHGLHAALQYINRLGINTIERHDLRLTDLLISRLIDTGRKIASPLEKDQRSAIVSFEGDNRIMASLLKSRVIVSIRYSAGRGGIRVSPHFFNDEGEIERLIEVVRATRDSK